MAKILGKEEALFVLTGTMGNLLCILRYVIDISSYIPGPAVKPGYGKLTFQSFSIESSIEYNSIFILACAEEEKKSSVVT